MMRKRNGDIKKLLSKNDRIHFIKRLYELINHGYMLEDSLELVMIQFNISENIIKYFKEEMYKGKRLSYVLKLLGYSEVIISKIKFAEQYGRVETMLLEVENYLSIKKNQYEKIITTIRYPAILITTLIALIAIFNILIIPQFENIYSTANLTISKEVSILIEILYYLPKFLIFLILLIFLYTLYVIYLYKKKEVLFLKIATKLPIFRKYFKYYFSYQYSQELSLFLNSGFSIKLALEEIYSRNYNKYFSIFSKKIASSLELGNSLENSILKIKNFDESIEKFILHGRKNSMLSKELKLYSDIMLDTLLKSIDKNLKKFQPILFLLLALIIIGLYLVILLPIFNMTNAIQ